MYREYHLADVESAQISIIINIHNPIKIAVSGKTDTTICTFCGVQAVFSIAVTGHGYARSQFSSPMLESKRSAA